MSYAEAILCGLVLVLLACVVACGIAAPFIKHRISRGVNLHR